MPIDAPLYPINLIVAGRRCLVVGGGTVAARKVEGLLTAGARVEVVATLVGDEVRALGVPYQARPYRPSDLNGAWLVIAATDDPAVNRRIHDDADAAGVWINAADDPPACSFILPAVVRQGPLMVTVSTAGSSPALASWLKSVIAAQLGPEWAELAEMLADARRRLHEQGRSTEAVDWSPALDWAMLDLIKAGQSAQARERLEACL